MDNEQLYKRQNENYKEVYPNTLLSSILDKESGKSLKDIINAYNHLYVPFVNNIYETLTAIPVCIRRKGLWVTWGIEDEINTYQFNLSTAEAADDSVWGNIESWTKILDKNNGTTEDRPTINLYIGQEYFDTTINKPIWYKGNNEWVDATGTPV